MHTDPQNHAKESLPGPSPSPTFAAVKNEKPAPSFLRINRHRLEPPLSLQAANPLRPPILPRWRWLRLSVSSGNGAGGRLWSKLGLHPALGRPVWVCARLGRRGVGSRLVPAAAEEARRGRKRPAADLGKARFGFSVSGALGRQGSGGPSGSESDDGRG